MIEAETVLGLAVMGDQPGRGGQNMVGAHQCFRRTQESNFRDKHVECLPAFIADDLAVFL